MADTRVGFVGVGFMGHGMAKNIVEKGYPLTVIAHRRRDAVDDLVGRGATEVRSLAALAEASDILFLCLNSSEQVETTVAAMRPGLKAGSVVVDCSTSEPASTVRLAAELAAAGVDYADAPLARTPKEAWEGKLDTMVGAEPAVLERIRPVMETWAAKIVHVGGIGDGHRVKLINNFIALGYGALYAEALTLTRKVGLTPQHLDNVIRGSRMECGFYQTFMAYTLEGDRESHKFTLTNAYKDLRYVEQMANSAGAATPLASAAKNTMALAVAAGGDGPEDYLPHLPDFVARASGLR